MKYLTSDVNEKHKLEAQGFECIGMHTIREGNRPTGRFNWEFDIPQKCEPPVEKDIEYSKIITKQNNNKNNKNKKNK